MSTTTQQFTQEQIRTNFNAAIKRLEPAKLKNTLEDRTFIERLITQQMIAKQLEPTADNFYSVFNTEAIFTVLPWAVKPAKLVRIEKNAAPATVESSLKLNEQRAKTVKDAEIADAHQKEQESFEQSALDLINGFLPYTRNGQRIDYRRQEEVQSHLKKYLAQQKAKGASMKEAHAAISAEIQRQYALLEKERERV